MDNWYDELTQIDVEFSRFRCCKPGEDPDPPDPPDPEPKVLRFVSGNYADAGKPLVPDNSDYTVITRFIAPDEINDYDHIQIWSEEDSDTNKRIRFFYQGMYYVYRTFNVEGEWDSSAFSTDISLKPSKVSTLTVTKQGDTVVLYIDGMVIGVNYNHIAKRSDNASHRLFKMQNKFGTGSLISHTIYNRALSIDEIIAYNPAKIEKGTKNVVAHYDTRSETEFNILKDIVGNNYLTIHGAEWVDDPKAPSILVVKDSFNRPNSGASLGVADTGQEWHNHVGIFGIEDGKARLMLQGVDNATFCYTAIPSGVKDFAASFVITKFAGIVRLVYRGTDVNNYLALEISSDKWSVVRVVNNVTTLVKSVDRVTPDGTRVQVTCRRFQIYMYANTELAMTYSEMDFREGTFHGMGLHSSTSARIDNFRVIDIYFDNRGDSGNSSGSEDGRYELVAVDNFDRPNSNTLGPRWISLLGNWAISNQSAYNPGVLSLLIGKLLTAVMETGVSDCIVQLTFAKVSPESRLAFRVVDNDNQMQVKAGLNNYTIRRVVRGISTVIATANITPKDGDVVAIRAQGDDIVLIINGVQAVTVKADNFKTATNHGMGGLGFINLSPERHKDFRVWKL